MNMLRHLTCLSLVVTLTLSAQNPVRVALQMWSPPAGAVVDIAHCGDDRIFVVGLDGVVQILTDSMQFAPRPFLDISTLVDFSGEKGLLGMAFAPDYATSGTFYLHYVAPVGVGRSIISRWQVSSDPDSADAASEQVIYWLDQPYENHKGGDLDFGPDGMLYIGFGDGGSGGDPERHGQNLTDPLGDMLRIDVSDPDTTYTIPADNPYVNADNDTLPEIFASGLRNPFRWGFDRLTGDLWIGDVGQASWEEWDHLPAGDLSGANFGWNCFEGDMQYSTDVTCQAQSFYTGPVVIHMNDGIGGVYCSAIGGRVYRGSAWPHFYGRYFYTDFCAPEISNLRPDGSGGYIDELSLTTAVSAWTVIAENAAGELFAGNLGQGRVYKLVDQCPMDPPTVLQNGGQLESSLANGYQWFLNGDTIDGATGAVYVPLASGDYHVIADFGTGCLLSSDTLVFIFTSIDGMEVPTIGVAPTPADGTLNVTWHHGEVTSFGLLDAAGRTVLSGPVNASSFTVGTSTLPVGGYALRLLSREGAVVATTRVIVAR